MALPKFFKVFYGEDSKGLKEKGMNSFQLSFHDNRWWILNMLWTMETKSNPLPEKFQGN